MAPSPSPPSSTWHSGTSNPIGGHLYATPPTSPSGEKEIGRKQLDLGDWNSGLGLWTLES
ncbi:hypothetical protein E2562_025940 [Oryza meyeriana var. granulata]|uniref:Uncharacterized protein n=1 Tax=Oryza meyeriana var. granulata TaxID=110450 RepID=A0A6G1EZ07_9ORYZ|nr:hypothetical protein E2562_025940 [Oryza meyeriana var. granulata]